MDDPPVPPCPVGPAGRAWIEARLAWLLRAFDPELPRTVEVVLPSSRYFPGGWDGSPDAATAVFENVRTRMGLEDEPLRFGFYREDDGPGPWEESRRTQGSAGHFVPAGPGEPQVVRLNHSTLADQSQLIATVAHELGHVLLIGQGRLSGTEDDHEPLTDLLTVLFGFGVFTSGAAIHERNEAWSWTVGRLGYLRQEHFAYALALFARLRGERVPAWASELSTDVRVWFRESLAFLEATDWDPAQLEATRDVSAKRYAFLWERASEEEPATRSSIGWLWLLAVFPLLMCGLGMVVPDWLRAQTTPLHVLNATPWPAEVALDGSAEPPLVVEPGGSAVLHPGSGRHVVRVVDRLGSERHELLIEPGEPQRGAEPLFVLNLRGAAVLTRELVRYGRSAMPLPQPELFLGEPVVVVPPVHFPFTTPPLSLLTTGGGDTRWVARWAGQGAAPEDVLELVHSTWGRAAALRYARLRLGLEPERAALHHAIEHLEHVAEPAATTPPR